MLKADLRQQPTQPQSSTSSADVFEDSGVSLKTMKRYLAYLVAVGFLERPPGEGKLPEIELRVGQREALGNVGGRGGMV